MYKRQFFPITADPLRNNGYYKEILPKGDLRWFVRCFWGTPEPQDYPVFSTTVIPDMCMDIIFYIDCSSGSHRGIFCGLDESFGESEIIDGKGKYMMFGIRFYAWSAFLFSDNSFGNTKNRAFDIGDFFGGFEKEMEPYLTLDYSIGERAYAAEKLLAKRVVTKRFSADLMNCADKVIVSNGSIRLPELCSSIAVSEKTLERLFRERMGISPKTFISLTRYQMLWQEIALLRKDFDIMDAVLKYGYYDQPHLINDFKKRHGTTPLQAVERLGKG